MNSKTLPAFSREERVRAHLFLAAQVAAMMGRKLEEDDWAHVYCAAKKIPRQGWSNLNLDIMHEGLGVEHKMIRRPSDRPMLSYCGESIMHPAATRSIRIPITETDPDKVMRAVLGQYAELIDKRRKKVQEDANKKDVDMRTGWLLWQDSLREFLYFEERMETPDTKSLYAIWKERDPGGARKGSKNLWVFDKKTKRKRYSITTEAGAKIQPYFDVPPPNEPNLVHFTVQGEPTEDGLIRIWVTGTTARELQSILGSIDPETLSDTIRRTKLRKWDAATRSTAPGIVKVILFPDAYTKLRSDTGGVSDEHCVQLLLGQLREKDRG